MCNVIASPCGERNDDAIFCFEKGGGGEVCGRNKQKINERSLHAQLWSLVQARS